MALPLIILATSPRADSTKPSISVSSIPDMIFTMVRVMSLGKLYRIEPDKSPVAPMITLASLLGIKSLANLRSPLFTSRSIMI